MHTWKTSVMIVACVTVLVGGAWLLAGPLNPPTGPISSGGKTTQEIYDAVTGISDSIGAVGGRGPAVPGASTGAGTIVMTGSQPFSGPIIGMRMSIATPYVASTGQAAGTTALQGSVTIVRAVSAGSAAVFRSEITNVTGMTATITIPSTGGNAVYLLSTVKIFGYRNYLVQRGDGTFGAIEEIDLYPRMIQITDPSSAVYSWDLTGGP